MTYRENQVKSLPQWLNAVLNTNPLNLLNMTAKLIFIEIDKHGLYVSIVTASVLLGIYILYRIIKVIRRSARETWLSNLSPSQIVQYHGQVHSIKKIDWDNEGVYLFGIEAMVSMDDIKPAR
jgi:hypothetical protein